MENSKANSGFNFFSKMSSPVDSRRYFIAILAIFAIGFFLRVYNLGTFSIWLDEKISACIANGININEPIGNSTITQKQVVQKNSIGNVISATVSDNGNSIVYNILLHGWAKLFGNSDGSLRSLSVVASVLLLLVVYLFVRNFFGSPNVTLLSLLFVAFHGLLIVYSHQARAYSWATLFTFLSSLFFIKIFFSEKETSTGYTNYGGYIFFGALSLLTHYLTICVFIAHAIIILLLTKRSRYWFYFLGAGITIGLLFGLWFYFGALDGYKLLSAQNAIYASNAAKFKAGDDTFVMPATLKNVLTGIMQVWLRVFANSMQMMNLRIREIAITLFIPISVISIAYWKTKDRDTRRKILILLVLTFTQTIFVTFLALKSGHCISFQPSYAIFVVPYAMILLAYSFITLFNSTPKIKLYSYCAFTVWIIIMCISLYPILTDRIAGKQSRVANPYIKLAGIVERSYSDGDTLVAPLPKDIYLLNLYLRTNKEILQKADTNIGKEVHLIRQEQNDTLKLIDLKGIQY